MKLKARVLLISFLVLVIIATYFYKLLGDASNSSIATDVLAPSYVYGWHQFTSKNVRDYVDENTNPLIKPKNLCIEKAMLMVVVHSKPENFEARAAIRETWGQKRENITFVYLLGQHRSYDYEVQLRLEDESRRNDDLVKERFIDSYNNLTLKSIYMLKLFTRHCVKSHKYLMKIDDDVFLNVDDVLEMLTNRNSTSDLLTGKLMNNTKPFRQPSSKWYVPYALYSDENYPDYICGSTYLMSSDVADKLYRCALDTPIFYIEDIYVTGICAKRANITLQHNPLVACDYTIKKYICWHKQMYAVHSYNPEEMKISYNILKNDKCPVAGSFMEWITSILY